MGAEDTMRNNGRHDAEQTSRTLHRSNGLHIHDNIQIL
jgi:hypothetical protein